MVSQSSKVPVANSSNLFVHDGNCGFTNVFSTEYTESSPRKPISYEMSVKMLTTLRCLPQCKNLVYYFTSPIKVDKK